MHSSGLTISWPPTGIDGQPGHVTCRNCAATTSRIEVLTTQDAHRRRVCLLACELCTARFFEEMPDADYGTAAPDLSASLAFYLQQGAGMEGMANRLSALGRPRGTRYLEIGCGFGLGIDIARRALGWTAVGVDPSPFAAVGHTALGLPIEQRLFEPNDALSGPFDVVHASEFIEHVADPLGMLRRLREALAPDGTLLLTTPAAEMIRPDTPDGLLLPLLSVGWHVVLQTVDSFSMLLRRAGLAATKVWREGSQLIAVAGNVDPAAAADRDTYIRWLTDVAAAVPPGSDLGLGVRARLYRAFAVRGDGGCARRAWEDLDAATQTRFGRDLMACADMAATKPLPCSLEALAQDEPLFLGGVMLWRGYETARAGAPADAYFQAAIASASRLRTVLRATGCDDGDAAEVQVVAQAELAVSGVLSGDAESTARLVSIAQAQGPEAQGVRWRCLIGLVNRGRLAEGHVLSGEADALLDDPIGIDHLRASVVFCSAALELQTSGGRHDMARDWLHGLRGRLLAAHRAGNPLPARELYWPSLDAEILALRMLGLEHDIDALTVQAREDTAGIPGLCRSGGAGQ